MQMPPRTHPHRMNVPLGGPHQLDQLARWPLATQFKLLRLGADARVEEIAHRGLQGAMRGRVVRREEFRVEPVWFGVRDGTQFAIDGEEVLLSLRGGLGRLHRSESTDPEAVILGQDVGPVQREERFARVLSGNLAREEDTRAARVQLCKFGEAERPDKCRRDCDRTTRGRQSEYRSQRSFSDEKSPLPVPGRVQSNGGTHS